MSQSASDIEIRKGAELALLASDIRWAWCFANDCANNPTSSPLPILCVLSYLSLVIYESQAYMAKANTALANTLSLQRANIIEQSRHRIKLFDDNKRGIEGVAEYFSEGLMVAHKEKFISSVRLPFAEFWKTDLGLVTYGGRQLATTHVIHFNMGTPPDMLTSPNTTLPKDIGEDMGKYLRYMTTLLKPQFPRFDWGADSFLVMIDSGKLAQRDVRSKLYYQSIFGGQLPIGILAALDAFRSAMETIDLLISADASPETAETLFKIRFVTLYHVLSGLEQLRSAHAAELNNETDARLLNIEQHATSVLLRQPTSKLFRNTLIHYGLDSRCPTTAIDLGKPLAGLVDHYFPGVGFTNLNAQLKEHAELVADSLSDWAGEGT